MGTLTCQRCGATSEGKSFEDADDIIDHAVGLVRGRPCSGKDSDLVWDTKDVDVEISDDNSDSDSTKPKKPKRR